MEGKINRTLFDIIEFLCANPKHFTIEELEQNIPAISGMRKEIIEELQQNPKIEQDSYGNFKYKVSFSKKLNDLFYFF